MKSMVTLLHLGTLLLVLFIATFWRVPVVEATIGCQDCHGTRIPADYRPVDATSRDPFTGGFQGNHRTHIGATTSAGVCNKCHPGSSSYAINHRNGTIKLSSNINSSHLQAMYRNVTSFPQTTTPTLGTCTNVNCHFEKGTPVWGTTSLFQSPNDCLGTCHGSPPNGGANGADGSHSVHNTWFPGLNNCSKCHPSHTVTPYFDHATSAANRGVVVKSSDPAYGPFGQYSGNTKDFLPSQANTFSKCNNFYCHSTVQGLTDPTQPPTTLYAPTWGGPPYASICGETRGCHGVGWAHPDDAPNFPGRWFTLNSGSHEKHLKYRFNELGNCQACHYNYTNNGTDCSSCHLVHGAFINHIDHTITMAFDPDNILFMEDTGSYSGDSTPGTPYGSCSGLYCHSDGTAVSTSVLVPKPPLQWGSGPLTCSGCHGYPPAYATGTPNKANSHVAHSGYTCNNCHYSTTTDGTSITTSRYHVNRAYNVTPGSSITFTYSFATSGGTCNNISCHHGGNATWGTTLPCNGCHDAPPATASHMTHYSGTVAQAGYGDTRIAQDLSANASGYIMNCGNCHPMDASRHGNGIIEVELYNAQAPVGSLKALNPSSAVYTNGTTVHTDNRGFAYTSGTCSNVYCHSFNEWTTPGEVASSFPCRTSLPPNLVTTRIYRQVAWGGSIPNNCTGCHALPPKTQYPANDGGSGDSHMTINSRSQEELHSWNMEIGEPLSCTYCHNDTVNVKNKVSRYLTVFNNITTVFSNYSAVPIANFSRHVNGRNDVFFNKNTPVVYNTWGSPATMYLTNSSYNIANKTCSNVACHLSQTKVKWGIPYRWYKYTECDRCHQYAYQCP